MKCASASFSPGCPRVSREKDEREAEEANFLPVREAIATFRDQIISHLADRGSLAARDVIKHLIGRFPEQEWFRWVLLRAEDNARRSSWQPPTLDELFALKRSQNRRFVGSEDELFEIVKESIGRLQEKLQGETESAEFLWNYPHKPAARPKEENELNNFVEIFLRDDLVGKGVLANREVQIRKGQKTDILVQVISKVASEARRYAVVIETKGIWNKEIPVAMSEQLAGRSLLNNQARHGILLVVWFVATAGIRRIGAFAKFQKNRRIAFFLILKRRQSVCRMNWVSRLRLWSWTLRSRVKRRWAPLLSQNDWHGFGSPPAGINDDPARVIYATR